MATPIPSVPPEEFDISYSPVFVVAAPVTLLAIGKYAYRSYRRVSSLHAHETVSMAGKTEEATPSNPNHTARTEPIAQTRSRIKHYFDLPFFVGLLGSPDWETGCSSTRSRIWMQKQRPSSPLSPVKRTDKCVLIPPNTLATCTQPQPILTPKSPVSIMEVFSPTFDISNCSVVHPHSPPCNETFANPSPLVPFHKPFENRFLPHRCPSTLPGCADSEEPFRHARIEEYSDFNIPTSSRGQNNGTPTLSPIVTSPTNNEMFDQVRKRWSPQNTPRIIFSEHFALDASVPSNASRSLSAESKIVATSDQSAGSSSGLLSDLETSILRTKSWELNDLLKDGHLDIEAVNDILGLGVIDEGDGLNDPVELSCSGTGWRTRDADSGELRIRSPGKPLCVIPEETDDIIESIAQNLSTLPASGWETRTHSGEKFCSSARSSACLEIDLSVLGPATFESGDSWGGQIMVDSASITASLDMI